MQNVILSVQVLLQKGVWDLVRQPNTIYRNGFLGELILSPKLDPFSRGTGKVPVLGSGEASSRIVAGHDGCSLGLKSRVAFTKEKKASL